ncbi:restriction endonuclease subunit S [Acidocella facilis]|uniref:restriction endonuclease subunit S n=1 Tax=Acidocella facilis TaxID=525 RepID=UPI000AE900ED|nr:restriction endonuclease subunit S [Acidocella facilis]
MPKDNPKLRLDAQFQNRAALEAIRRIEELPHLHVSDLTVRPLKGRNIGYSEEGDFPVIRSGDISNSFQPDLLLRSSDRAEAFFVKKNDILISSIGQGSIGKVQLFRSDGDFATVSEVTVVRIKGFSPACLSAFLASSYGQAQIERYITGATGQLHLYPNDVDRILVPKLSTSLQSRISRIYDRQAIEYKASQSSQERAEGELLNHLGLRGWTPPQPLSFTASASSALTAERIDAQFFRPLFAEVEARLLATGSACGLGSLLSANTRGRQPKYADEGLPVINSKHVRTNRVILVDNRTAAEPGAGIVIETGDVLVNGTGEGTIGRTAPYLHGQRALPDNHVTVLRTDHVDPVYLAVFLNSPLGQWQIERHIKGSSGQVELYPSDIARIMIWDAPDAVQQSVRAAILSAFDEERRANDLLDAAKRAVEIAIEDGEPAAMAYLDQAEGAI